MTSTTEAEQAADALYATGHRMLEHGRTNDAMDVFRAMLLLFPRDERAWLGLGLSHEELGQLEVAIELFSLATLAVSDSVRARVALARALRAKGRDADADDVLDSASERAERSDDAELVNLVQWVRRAA